MGCAHRELLSPACSSPSWSQLHSARSPPRDRLRDAPSALLSDTPITCCLLTGTPHSVRQGSALWGPASEGPGLRIWLRQSPGAATRGHSWSLRFGHLGCCEGEGSGSFTRKLQMLGPLPVPETSKPAQGQAVPGEGTQRGPGYG